jgi:hypothetical protein
MTYVPTGNEVAVWRLVIYLCGCRQRKVELGREVQVQIEIFFWCCRLRFGAREARER